MTSRVGTSFYSQITFPIWYNNHYTQMVFNFIPGITQRIDWINNRTDIDRSHLDGIDKYLADAIGRRDYQLFGDSLSFDSTYDTNKYSLVFCPFTGVNNHKRCVTFCAALLSKEDRIFYVVVSNFFEVHGKRTLFVSAVVWDREIDLHVFVDGWNSVMEEFDLIDHEWFAYMFKIKHLWIRTYFRDLYMGGLLHSTSRPEALDAQRHEQDDLIRLNKLEPQLVTHLHLEKHATVVHNHAIFYDFQEECEGACFSCGVESCSSLYGDGVEFSVIIVHEKSKNFDVTFDLATYESSCTCRMFESQGILCRHILFVMKDKCIREIPDSYILNRWRKDVLKKAYVTNAALDDASKYYKKKQLMISKNNPENAPSSKEVKDADIQVLVGSNEVDVNILRQNQCLK
ncbi:protein FAR1-RELATED SEQUENCE 9-like [Chenopodium quinoa]|uniref:protein FAR1-RELATED SEQUENCE 9-like n=1 Tax=Chenopodium quinoa TaxID=63459 RepID=UPI000B797BDE|nr:protein FAR1-RELATED SEQUENCE 9-like [Chenopodium quinoa]